MAKPLAVAARRLFPERGEEAGRSVRFFRHARYALNVILFAAVVAVVAVAASPLRADAREESPTMSSRRWVLCLDGTWNSTYVQKQRSDGHKVLKPSNVLKLCRAVLPFDEESRREQVTYYDAGVGSMSKFSGVANSLLQTTDKFLGGAFGAGFEANIEEALTLLVHNRTPGDQVFLFGFSRGAAEARGLTRFLDWAGGLPAKGDAYYLPRFFREYIAGRGEVSADEVRRAVDAERAAEPRPRAPLAPFQPVEITFLGVWDTVMALGSRFRAAGESTSTASRSFHVGARPAACVRHARQALAIDEARYDFRPEVWTGCAADQTLEQRWFAGVHSNVGGGYVDDGLANLAFHWILDEAASRGLAVSASFAGIYNGYAQDRLYRSESWFYRLLDGLRLRFGRGKRSLSGWPASAHLTLAGVGDPPTAGRSGRAQGERPVAIPRPASDLPAAERAAFSRLPEGLRPLSRGDRLRRRGCAPDAGRCARASRGAAQGVLRSPP